MVSLSVSFSLSEASWWEFNSRFSWLSLDTFRLDSSRSDLSALTSVWRASSASELSVDLVCSWVWGQPKMNSYVYKSSCLRCVHMSARYVPLTVRVSLSDACWSPPVPPGLLGGIWPPSELCWVVFYSSLAPPQLMTVALLFGLLLSWFLPAYFPTLWWQLGLEAIKTW